MTLLGEVVEVLARERIRFALIGASAMAVHGVSRATLDIDLLTTDARALDAALWAGLSHADVRRGDADDPLAGVVRVAASPDVVDVEGPPSPRLRRAAFAWIESEGWCGREDWPGPLLANPFRSQTGRFC